MTTLNIGADDSRYQYIQSLPAFSVAQLDGLMTFVTASGTGTVGAIIAGVKIILVTAYVIAREKLTSQEATALKQQYEQAQGNKNQSQINNDSLSAVKR